jgi:hypothetical protein
MSDNAPSKLMLTLTTVKGKITQPQWNRIEQSILEMDGKTHYSVILELGDGSYLQIGGGQNQEFVCEAEVDQGQFKLTDPSQPPDKTITVMDGQPVDYLAQHVIKHKDVIEAAKHFAATGHLLPSLNWKRI